MLVSKDALLEVDAFWCTIVAHSISSGMLIDSLLGIVLVTWLYKSLLIETLVFLLGSILRGKKFLSRFLPLLSVLVVSRLDPDWATVRIGVVICLVGVLGLGILL